MFEPKLSPFGNIEAELTVADLLIKPKLGQDVNWVANHPEGQLTVDVFEENDELVVIATMAGTRPEDIELHLHNDSLTIRGSRLCPAPNPTECYYQECFWGVFSRTIVLPLDVKTEFTRAEYKNGVLTIRLPKAQTKTAIPILVVEE